MSRLLPFEPPSDHARIKAALAAINVGTVRDLDRAHLRAEREIDRRCRTWPTAAQVAALRSVFRRATLTP